MNLLEMMRQEVSVQNLENKIDIANYLYFRVGQIFEYDPLWAVANEIERKKIKNKEIDIENVTDFYIVCFSWARMFEKLLLAFSIHAFATSDSTHAYVLAKIDGKNYCFDLTKDYADLMLIKFGMHPIHNFEVLNGDLKKEVSVAFDEQNGSLVKIKELFETKKAEFHWSEEEYTFLIYKWIEKKINFSHLNIGYVSGNCYVDHILKFFLGENYEPCYSKFYDKNSRTFFRVYAIKRRGKFYYFSYQQTQGQNFVFREIDSLEEIRVYLSMYSVEKPYNLVLQKNSSTFGSRVA